jgi:hypothetical protein
MDNNPSEGCTTEDTERLNSEIKRLTKERDDARDALGHAYRSGAEAMREKAARWASDSQQWGMAVMITSLQIPGSK